MPRTPAPRGRSGALVRDRSNSAQFARKDQLRRGAAIAGKERPAMISAKGKLTQGRPIDLETKRFRLRSLKPIDASERWLRWVKDPEVVHPSNGPVRHMTRQELANYIATFNNHMRFLIGYSTRRVVPTSAFSSLTSIGPMIPRPST